MPGVDVTVTGSQKGLMLLPGLGFNCVSRKALEAHEKSGFSKFYRDWARCSVTTQTGFPYAGHNLLFGLEEALKMLLDEEGLPHVFARHQRHAKATRIAGTLGAGGAVSGRGRALPVLTGVLLPDEHDADHVRNVILDKFDMSLGTGLGKIKGKVFRIGHLGHLNDLTMMGTLWCRNGAYARGFQIKAGDKGAMDYLRETATSLSLLPMPAPSQYRVTRDIDVWCLAVAETIIWAGSLYLFAALLPYWESELGWPKTHVAMVFSGAVHVRAAIPNCWSFD